jgi:hypothetical protein
MFLHSSQEDKGSVQPMDLYAMAYQHILLGFILENK